mmetsp:Transcript_9709/g.18710  ORF Transcript_9709/g.18710 Transcript_9709/m.18710 type:complete len:266 (+) Transcript_9709:37-834(+)
MMESPAPSQRVYMTGLPATVDRAKLLSIFGAYGTIEESALLQNGAAIIKFATLAEATWFVNNLNGNMPEGLTTPVSVHFAKPRGTTSTSLGGRTGSVGIGSNRMSMNPGINSGLALSMSKNGGGTWSPGLHGGRSAGRDQSSSSIQLVKTGFQSSGPLSPSQAGKGQRSEAQQLCISGLPTDTTDKDLYDLFGPFGAIPMKGVKAMLGPDGRCTGVGFVDYLDAACAANAVNVLNGTILPDGTQLHLHQKGAAPASMGMGKGFGL